MDQQASSISVPLGAPVDYPWNASAGAADCQVPEVRKPERGDDVPANALFDTCEKSAKQCDPAAQCECGVMFMEGRGVERNDQQAFHYFTQAANQNHALAHKYLGDFHRRGQGTIRDYAKACQHYERSAELGDPSAMVCMGEMCNYVAKDVAKSVAWYKKAADTGYAYAEVKLGEIYFHGTLGISVNPELANTYLQRAAEKGSPLAYYYLGVAHERGYGVSTDIDQAKKYHIKAFNTGLEAVKGRSVDKVVYAAICTMLGNMLRVGSALVKKNVVEAKRYYEEAAREHHVGACCYLAEIYEKGIYAPKDEGKAAELYQISADKGFPLADTCLGKMYQDGRGVPQDFVKAREHYEKAYSQGDLEAGCNLAWMYIDGLGVAKHPAKALEYFQIAVAKGYARGFFDLGWLYENGIGVSKDIKKAVAHYRAAKDKGSLQAVYQLGNGYLGDGLNSGWIAGSAGAYIAAGYFKFAADRGHIKSCAQMGGMYRIGMGVSKDIAKAKAYLNTAIKEADDGLAHYYLGLIFEEEGNYTKALECLGKAADKKVVAALERLRVLYSTGNMAIPKDLSKAFIYTKQAADMGNASACVDVAKKYWKSTDPEIY